MDLATLRRGVRRVCFGAAAGCAVLATVGSPVLAQSTDDEAGPRPEVFSGAASALGASVAFDRPGLLPLEHVFTYIVADGVGTYRTSEQRGRASLFFPGNGLIQGPALACSQFPPEAEPVFGPILAACAQYSFPLSVATDSLTPDGATEGSLQLGEPTDPISANGVGARSHAGEDSVTTNAEISDFRMLGSPAIGPLPAVPGFEDLDPYLITIGGVTAVTDQRIDADGALVVDAASAVSDIGLVGGLVNIGSVVSRARIVDGEEEPVTETSLEVSGVTVAGMPAQLTEDGLQLSTASQPLGPQLEALTDQLGTALESLSFRMETLGVEQGVDEDGISFARVGGVLISMSVPVGGLAPVPGPLGDIDLNGDYQGTMVLGQVGARAIAGSFDSEAAGTTGGGASPVASGAGGSTGSGGSTGGGATSPGATPAAAPAAAPAAPEADISADPLRDLFADRLKLLYLAFTLAGFAICLAPRMALPARLPGPLS